MFFHLHIHIKWSSSVADCLNDKQIGLIRLVPCDQRLYFTMVSVAMPNIYAYETVRQIDHAVKKLEKYTASHANEVKQAQIMRRVILEGKKKRNMLLAQARREGKNAQKKSQEKEEKPKGKGRPRNSEGRCTACINRYLKVKGGVNQHFHLEVCRQTQYEFTNDLVGTKATYGKKSGSLATRVSTIVTYRVDKAPIVPTRGHHA